MVKLNCVGVPKKSYSVLAKVGHHSQHMHHVH